jgi:hypothetical protein
MMSSCAEQQKTTIQSSPANSQPVSVQEPVNQTSFVPAPVNNPVDYDYMGQTIHLTVDEKLASVGSFQDKLKRMKPNCLKSLRKFRTIGRENPNLCLRPYSNSIKRGIHRGYPVTVALINCSNLISSDEVEVLQNTATISEKKIVIDSEGSLLKSAANTQMSRCK